jgi:DNA-binding CsgD family transcriptional regulator
MTLADPIETTFQQTLTRAYQVADRLLRSQLGAHAGEDVVSTLIEKALNKGKGLSEIQEMLSGPGMYRRLENVKNDIYRWETAAKRGGTEPSVSYEDAEPFLGTTIDDPESELIRKEDFMHRKDLLIRLIEKAELSETQIEILKLDQSGYSSKRIARELGIAVDAVYARRSEALRKLASAAKQIRRNE